MKGVIDRIEDKYVVIELEEGAMVNIPFQLIPKDAREGDVLIIDISIDRDETENRKKTIEELTRDLWDE
ncbi:DUF3006 domain-containing protein [Clostridium malenominatum]|uniref:DUF3006 domain-containing protein n=1 Tax=Clostridium malenominatum TaxID=1539 RepID=A0ABN1J260_9CLOT